jgi:glycosyltransferase involved in cell wall biosynthesis
MEEGVPEEKIRTVPLAYQSPVETANFRRSYPDAFTHHRPLRVLFLGQINLRKGTAVILEAIRRLRNEPVEFWFVGPRQMELSVEWLSDKQVRWLGAVPRSETQRYYQEADAFLFPTFSDGFGLTQLEAQAWKLPIIASRFCGDVVRDGINGMLLKKVSAEAIVETIYSLMADPGRLNFMSRNAVVCSDFGVDQLGSHLLRMVAS